ncbi:DUF1697 domain-containing protein [Arenimonas oryziterrae]|uniref:DUF1697 domain-containing protein n=1 Tax=Arenimonas oryziterrae DSM 21050 = YC6267 TaxID=1121015 RepID=A0A091AYP6_9GAMM|nr:DUF1697 domain-containing protein [Arenimonas oryziterrae]KFN44546.1 hypothetical protein N789_00635 [Arenimonas oryziterrae DSM 21050 = YC6267]
MIYLAFLRAINVGGRIVKMDALRALFEAMKLQEVETFIASGNVIFRSRSADAAALEKRIATGLHKALGYEVATFLRTNAELAEVAAYSPFPAGTIAKAHGLYVGFLAAPLTVSAKAAVLALADNAHEFHVAGREVYWLAHINQADSKLSNATIERALQGKATFRNITTVRKLVSKYPVA